MKENQQKIKEVLFKLGDFGARATFDLTLRSYIPPLLKDLEGLKKLMA